MSIYIPKLTIPEKGAKYICIRSDGTVCSLHGDPLGVVAVEVPAHGPLKDADAFEKLIRAEHEAAQRFKAGLNKDFVRGVERTIAWVFECLKENAKTIIAAEEEPT